MHCLLPLTGSVLYLVLCSIKLSYGCVSFGLGVGAVRGSCFFNRFRIKFEILHSNDFFVIVWLYQVRSWQVNQINLYFFAPKFFNSLLNFQKFYNLRNCQNLSSIMNMSELTFPNLSYTLIFHSHQFAIPILQFHRDCHSKHIHYGIFTFMMYNEWEHLNDKWCKRMNKMCFMVYVCCEDLWIWSLMDDESFSLCVKDWVFDLELVEMKMWKWGWIATMHKSLENI